MKHFIFLLSLCFSILVNAQTTIVPTYNANNILEIKNVQTTDKSKAQLFSNAQSMLSTFSDNRSTAHLDYSDINTGTIIYKASMFLAYSTCAGGGGMAGYSTFANFIITIKCKDNKYQVILQCPSIYLVWSPGKPANVTVDTYHIYPEYDGYKISGVYYTKKYLQQAGPLLETKMISLYNHIISQFNTTIDNDDF